jgi:hypothetical protein
MQRPTELHSEATASRMGPGDAPRRHAPVWLWVAVGAWLLAAGFFAGATSAGEDSFAFEAGRTFAISIIALVLAFLFQSVGRLFYRRHPFRQVWTPELFAMATGFVLVILMLVTSPGA